ncbi:hypothetical protein [Fischerella sp. PCC 9605]|uniref:hypothetical protein n=1 Tax=Fischerella sp. PCC 9605 TaxID=1173024 RepID=UPI00047AC1AD|nr:hypothetical protein [Fischerella sp. PCC 9605]
MLIQDAITGQITRGTIDNEVIVEQSNIVPVPRDDALAQLHTVQPFSDRSIESLIVEANHLNDSIEGNFETIQSLKETTWSECIRLGDILNVIKSQCPHGEWGKLFRKGSFKFTIRTAQRYMDCANNRTLIAEFAEKEKSLGIKSITRALAGHRKESNKNDTVSHLPDAFSYGNATEDIQDVEVIEEPQLRTNPTDLVPQQELPASDAVVDVNLFSITSGNSQFTQVAYFDNEDREISETTENRSLIENKEKSSAAVHEEYAPIAEVVKRLKAEVQRLNEVITAKEQEIIRLKEQLEQLKSHKPQTRHTHPQPKQSLSDTQLILKDFAERFDINYSTFRKKRMLPDDGFNQFIDGVCREKGEEYCWRFNDETGFIELTDIPIAEISSE